MKVLTISIASYNVEKFLKQAIDSLVSNRILDDLEIIIVNDGSSDNTLAIAREYEGKYPNSFVVIDKENGGYGSTINCSMKIATGKYYKLLDGDDWYDTNSLEILIDFLKKTEVDLVITPYIEYVDDTAKTTQIDTVPELVEKRIITFEDFPNAKRLSNPQVCFRTNAIKNEGIEIREHCFYTDTEYLLKCLSKCETITKINLPLYVYRIGLDEQSMSLQGLNRHYQDVVIYYKEMIRFYNEERLSLAFKENYFNDAMISLARYHLTNYLLMQPSRKKDYIEFDEYIKKNAPIIYDKSNCKTLSILRKTHNLLFRPLSFLERRKARNRIRV